MYHPVKVNAKSSMLVSRLKQAGTTRCRRINPACRLTDTLICDGNPVTALHTHT